ncbi:MAG TPA: putative aminohydrolase SsnA [Candidatus Cloacimonadota bacterium]|nr:putative aminohydrolase SsnA [Candidatus Cloacimonadota bacterium]HQL14344.1 putative aminohydrolase SsnA [Candidatus Cloacimonadota bacterium]
MDKILINKATVLTLEPENPVLTDKSILIENGIIKKLAPRSEFPDFDGIEIDAEGKVAVPGFINAHHHFYSTMVRGLTKAIPAKDFTAVLNNLWWRLDKKLNRDDIYYSALMSELEAIKHGTTTIIDHHASPGMISGSLEEIAESVRQTGLRANLCYEVSDRDGEDKMREGVKENVNWLRFIQAEPNEFLKGLFGLHAAFTLSDKTLEMIAAETENLNCGIHIHVAEAASDEEFNQLHYGKRIVNRLNDFHLLNDKSIAAHCVHIDENEMEILAKLKVAVVHNPQSNLNNGVGIADVVNLVQKGIMVCLGTDAMTVNMPEEIRCGIWAQHLKHDPSQGFMEIADALLKNNAILANRYWGNKLGRIKEGMAADLVLFDYYPPTPLDETSWVGHIIYGLSQAVVDTTICAGKILYQNKDLKLDLDEKEAAAKSRECASKLWARF